MLYNFYNYYFIYNYKYIIIILYKIKSISRKYYNVL